METEPTREAPPERGRGREKPKKKRPAVRYVERYVERDDGEGNWLVSYADMMTLLFGFFVILSAFSTPDPEKIEQLKRETARSMGVAYENPYQDLAKTLENTLRDFDLEDQVKVKETDEGITIISKGTLFFDSGSSELKPQAAVLVEKIADIVVTKARGFNVIVEGHTDDVPIVSDRYPSNWELSASRAGTVVRLLEDKGYPHEGLRPMGLADIEPVVPNRNARGEAIPENQAQNRRIVMRIRKVIPKRL